MLTTALAGVGAILGTTIGSAQDAATAKFNCRASLASIDEPLITGVYVEPLIANGEPSKTAPDRDACHNDFSTAPDVDFTDPLVTALDNALVKTEVTPSEAAERNTTVNTARTSASKISIDSSGAVLTADAVQSQASVSCVAGVPKLTGSSSVATVKLGGQDIPVDDTLNQVATQLINLTMLANITVNGQTITDNAGGGKTLTQTALTIELLPIIGPPLETIKLGESKASYTAAVCENEPPPKTVTTTETIKESVPGPTTTETTTQTVPGPTTTQTQTQTVPGPTKTVVAPPTVVKQTVEVQPNGTPASNCAKLTMYFQTNRKKTLTTKFAKERVVTRGRLVSCGGRSIRGARIDVIHVLPSGERRLVKTGMRTRELGRATLILPKNLFTRKLEFRYRPNLASTVVASKQTLSLRVRNKAGKLVTKAPPGQGKVDF
jgi:hypothetical protein